MDDTQHSTSEQVTALSTHRVMSDQIAELTAQVKMWKLGFEVQVKPDGHDKFMVEIMASVGNQGYLHHVPAIDISHFAGDYEGIGKSIAAEIVAALLLDKAVAELNSKFVRACENAKRMNGPT